MLSTYLDAQEHLPYADDSAAVTPMSEENGAIIVPVYTNLGSRHNSYTSHTSRISYTSHGDLLNGKPPTTKESQLRSRSRNMASSLVPEVIIVTFSGECVSSGPPYPLLPLYQSISLFVYPLCPPPHPRPLGVAELLVLAQCSLLSDGHSLPHLQ